jgi:hypothetical protein
MNLVIVFYSVFVKRERISWDFLILNEEYTWFPRSYGLTIIHISILGISQTWLGNLNNNAFHGKYG